MKRIFTLLLALLLLSSPLSAFAAVGEITDPIYNLSLDSQGVYVYNPETQTAVYEKSADVRMYPASTTKIMTALVALELCADPRTEIITCPDTEMFRYIIQDGGVNMQLSRGEEFTAFDLLTGLMMVSYCDAADLLAWHFGKGDVSAFVAKMNEKAKALGLENTNFENAHGLHSANHYSSPRDIARILEEAVKNPLFREIISTRDYTIPATRYHRARVCRYTVSIYYPSNGYYMDCFVGGKSGFTDQAGRCLATWSEKDGVSYVSVLLGANMDSSRRYTDNMSWVETNMLLSHAYEHYEIKTVLEKGTVMGTIPVTDSETSLTVTAGEDIRILERKETAATYEFTLPEAILHTEVKNELVVAEASLLLDGAATERRYPLLLQWDGTPIEVKSALEKETETAIQSVKGIFQTDHTFVTVLILLLLVFGICLPAARISAALHKKNSHRPKH